MSSREAEIKAELGEAKGLLQEALKARNFPFATEIQKQINVLQQDLKEERQHQRQREAASAFAATTQGT